MKNLSRSVEMKDGILCSLALPHNVVEKPDYCLVCIRIQIEFIITPIALDLCKLVVAVEYKANINASIKKYIFSMKKSGIIQKLQACIPNLLAIYTFGGRTQGTAQPESDLDAYNLLT